MDGLTLGGALFQGDVGCSAVRHAEPRNRRAINLGSGAWPRLLPAEREFGTLESNLTARCSYALDMIDTSTHIVVVRSLPPPLERERGRLARGLALLLTAATTTLDLTTCFTYPDSASSTGC